LERLKYWTAVLEANRGQAEDWRTAAGLGGLPVPSHVLSGAEERALWFSGYVQTYLENLVLTDLLAWRDLQARRPEVLYWRTATGVEVDFVIETPDRLLPIEIKAATRVRVSDAKGLELFLDEYPDLTDGALLLYAGSEAYPLTQRVLAVPWWQVI
jgi:predicted AAA+ superfamily ATPase